MYINEIAMNKISKWIRDWRVTIGKEAIWALRRESSILFVLEVSRKKLYGTSVTILSIRKCWCFRDHVLCCACAVLLNVRSEDDSWVLKVTISYWKRDTSGDLALISMILFNFCLNRRYYWRGCTKLDLFLGIIKKF